MHEELDYVERALRAGARGYVMKRESTSQIVRALRTVNDGAIYGDPAVLARMTERIVGQASPRTGLAIDVLSDRELDVFQRIGEGHSTRRIASDCGVSLKTVQTYYARIKEKLGIQDAAELRSVAARHTDAH